MSGHPPGPVLAGPVLAEPLLAALDAELAPLDAALAARYPGAGPRGVVPPVHTAYVSAAHGDAGTPAAWGRAALALLDRHAGDPGALAGATGLPPAAVAGAWDDLRRVLATRPVQDLRLDLEDGYTPGTAPGSTSGRAPHRAVERDAAEDADARRAGASLAALARQPAASRPLVAGVRVRSMELATRRRSWRTLDLVLAGLAAALGPGAAGVLDGGPDAARGAPTGADGAPPLRLVVTLAKVTDPAQVAAFTTALEAAEAGHGLPAGCLGLEVQVEVPAAVVAADGSAAVARVLEAARGRCTGLHFGTYDFTAACGVPPGLQSLEHPLADHAKAVLQLLAAGTGVAVSDGSTNVVPAGEAPQVHAAWSLHARLVRRALERGLPQGWDLHPGHLVTRHLATLVFYRAAAPEAVRRLAAWTGGDGRGGVLDEPATAQAMATLLLRAAGAGAADLTAVQRATGLAPAALAALAARRVA